ncbi:MAG: chemotaxis protein CheW, partial [Spirochaetia bacterium]|nr:chemotaxis protein CheW [Spirochaetia bacterium]
FLSRNDEKADAADKNREYIVIVSQSGKKAGLVVDGIHGEMQSVIKPLGAILGKLRGISGSTILGNGEVAFIMDVHSLIGLSEELERRSVKS